MTNLSVNINKVALLRNSRGGNVPDLLQVAQDCERFGAQGITVHPRPDERHVKLSDVPLLKEVVNTDFNIEGYPSENFMRLVTKTKPHQCTLVPDPPGALTSNEGWDTVKHKSFLEMIVKQLKEFGIRVSIFVDPIAQFIEGAAVVDADRVELYTGSYAQLYPQGPEKAAEKYVKAARFCELLGIGVNAGHDLNLDNLRYFKENVPGVLEVSIGHALIADSLYFGLENTIQMYRRQLA